MGNDAPPNPIDQPPEGRNSQGQELSPALLRALSARPQEMASLMSELHRRVHDEDSLIDLMHRSSREAVRLLRGVDGAGVTAQFTGPAFTAAHTDDRVLVADEGQYGQGDGPFLRAIATDSVVSMSSEEVNELWAVLAQAVSAAGVRAFLAEPLHVGGRPVGCLNLYSAATAGLSHPDSDVIAVLVEYLDRGLTDYSSVQPRVTNARGCRSNCVHGM